MARFGRKPRHWTTLIMLTLSTGLGCLLFAYCDVSRYSKYVIYTSNKSDSLLTNTLEEESATEFVNDRNPLSREGFRSTHGPVTPSLHRIAQTDQFPIEHNWETSVKISSVKGFCSPLPPLLTPDVSFFHCEWSGVNIPCRTRLRAVLACNNTSSTVSYEKVDHSSPPFRVSFFDTCLKRVVREHCHGDDLPVPRLVHYVTLGFRQKMHFYMFLSVISAVRFIQPCLVLFHGDYLPYGPYWAILLQLFPRVIHVQREQPTTIFGHRIETIQHRADIVRLQAMIVYGGVYLDLDQLVVRSLDDLRSHPATLGVEFNNSRICNAMFLGQPEAAFFLEWYEAYKTFDDTLWMHHSGEIPYRLALLHPDQVKLVHTFFRPNFKNMTSLYQSTYDWWMNHGVHLYYRFNKQYIDPGHLDHKNSSLGEITRHILYGSSTACIKGDKSNVRKFRTRDND